ncbi:MAG: S-layer homology domain-containing protein [Chloroflexota bacterium]
MNNRRNALHIPHLLACLICAVLILTLPGIISANATSPNPPPLDGFPRIGVEAHENEPAVFANLAEAGTKYVRVHLGWRPIEQSNTTPDHFEWANADLTFSRAVSAGVTPLITISECPLWACARNIGPLNENMYGEAAQFMQAVAARYSAPPYNIHYWEMWNEPDGAVGPTPGDRSWGWGNFPDRYALMLRNVYPAIKAVDPQAVIMTGGIAYGYFWDEGGPFNPNFLADVIANGGRPYFDAIGFHYYSNDPRYANIGAKADTIRAALGAAGAGIPFICTEAGLTSDPAFGSSEQNQARYIVKLYTWAASKDVRSVVWYLYKDYYSVDPAQQIFRKSGLVRPDSTRKPSFYALQTYSREVGSSAYLGELGISNGLPQDLEGYRFRSAPGTDPNKETWVVWSRAGVTATFTIPPAIAPTFVRAVGLQGDVLTAMPMPDGSLQLAVGADPIYVETNSTPPRFSDVAYSFWAYDYIEYLASRSIVGGYSDNTYRPSNPATRGQFSKMASLGAGWPLVNPPAPSFADVAQGSTFYTYVETAYGQGVISGYPCGGVGEPCGAGNKPYFRPSSNITRAQIAKIIVAAQGWPLLNPPQPTFSDIPAGSTFYQQIETAFSKGIISGYTCNNPEPCDPMNRPYFRPNNNATRAQLSKMLALALQASRSEASEMRNEK